MTSQFGLPPLLMNTPEDINSLHTVQLLRKTLEQHNILLDFAKTERTEMQTRLDEMVKMSETIEATSKLNAEKIFEMQYAILKNATQLASISMSNELNSGKLDRLQSTVDRILDKLERISPSGGASSNNST